MERKGSDLLKTIGAILVIGGIVVATFLYGNRQRQEQVRRDQQIRQEQEKKAAEESGPKVAVDGSKDNTTVKPENQATPKPAAPTPPATSGVGGGQLSSSGGTETTPKTGGELAYVIPAGLIYGLYKLNRNSRNWVRQAFLKN